METGGIRGIIKSRLSERELNPFLVEKEISEGVYPGKTKFLLGDFGARLVG